MANSVAPVQSVILGSRNATTNAVVGVTSGTSVAFKRAGFGILTFAFRSLGTTSGGTLIIEEADWLDDEVPYSGTWSQIASVAASSFTGTAQILYHISNSAYGYVRVRISSNITGGGTVAVTLRSQGAGA